ncbi:MAG: LpqB family beta-propeller domain-containing protein [Mycobacteriales bacterium]
MRRPFALLALLLLPACGLPLTEGVQPAGQVEAAREEPAPVRVIPPGPQPGASPQDIVRGFLNAQSSPDDGHAVARTFLAPGTTWDDEQGAVVYRARGFVEGTGQDPLTFTVRFDTTARIHPTGAFVLDDAPVPATYVVGRMPSGEYRLTSVPAGLHLTGKARERSFRPYDVHFLARALDGEATGRLVPDRVFLPETAARASALVGALVGGATPPLRPAVTSALPAGTGLASPVVERDGVVTVDLTGEVEALGARGRQRLSAQFAWTLVPAFQGVRLLVEGRPFQVEGAGEVQSRKDWPEYHPAGVDPQAPLYYVQGRKLRSLDGPLPESEATGPGPLPVDAVAVSPAGGALGLLSRVADDLDEVRTGPPEGPFGSPVLRRPGLGSLSWGPGDQGLWLVADGARPAVCLLAPVGRPPRADPCAVPYEQPTGAGPLSGLRVSRDGARIALVFGTGTARRLYVGRIEPGPAGPRIDVAAGPVARLLTDVTDVAWQSGTTLAVLASSGGSQVVLWNVTVDGSAGPTVVQRPGLSGDAVKVAAAAGRPLVVGALVDGQPRLFRDTGTLFREVPGGGEAGSAPAYPG